MSVQQHTHASSLKMKQKEGLAHICKRQNCMNCGLYKLSANLNLEYMEDVKHLPLQKVQVVKDKIKEGDIEMGDEPIPVEPEIERERIKDNIDEIVVYDPAVEKLQYHKNTRFQIDRILSPGKVAKSVNTLRRLTPSLNKSAHNGMYTEPRPTDTRNSSTILPNLDPGQMPETSMTINLTGRRNSFERNSKSRMEQKELEQQAALDLVKRMKKEKRIRQQRQDKITMKEQKKLMVELQQAEQDRKQREEQKKKDHEQLMLRIEQQNQQRIQKQQEWKNRSKEYVKVTKQVPVYEKLTHSFEEAYEMDQQASYQSKLDQQKDMMRRVQPNEIRIHSKDYRKVRKELSQEKTRARQSAYKDAVRNFKPAQFRTKLMETLQERQEVEKELQEQTEEEVQRLTKKKKNYSNIISETHKPRVSKLKQLQMQSKIREYNMDPTKKALRDSTLRNPDKKLKNLLHQNNQKPKQGRKSPNKDLKAVKAANSTQLEKQTKYEKDIDLPIVRESIRKKKGGKRDLDPTTKSLEKPTYQFVRPSKRPELSDKSVDYLKKARVRKNEQEVPQVYQSHNWEESITKNMKKGKIVNEVEQLDKIKYESDYIKKQALKKEEMLKGGAPVLEVQQDINEMLIDSINAKLTVLNRIND